MNWLSLDPITTVHSGLTIGYIQVSINLDILLILLSSIYDSQLDIHSGGEDLAFPHHKNELTQPGSDNTIAVHNGSTVGCVLAVFDLPNSTDPVETQHSLAFHLGQYCLLNKKKDLQRKKYNIVWKL